MQTNIKSKSQVPDCKINQLHENKTKKGNFFYLFKLNDQK